MEEVLFALRALANPGTSMIDLTNETGCTREVAHEMVFMDAWEVVETGTPSKVLDIAQHARTKTFLADVR